MVAIVDTEGEKVVEYLYDARGRLLETSGTKAADLGLHNPLRYRGYVYDPETGLYYLQSRYYNPELGRFINADDPRYLGTDGILSCNLFAYCGNNPVMGYDPTGCWDWGGVLCGLGMIAVTAVTVATIGVNIFGVLVAGAVVTTGAFMTGTAATDSAMVMDFSYSYQSSPGVYEKVGASIVIDFEEDEANLYIHEGFGYGKSSGPSYSAGVVHNYDEPQDYAGSFVNYAGGHNLGIDRCWSPKDGLFNGTGATSITFSNGLGAGVGYDFYSDPIRLWGGE